MQAKTRRIDPDKGVARINYRNVPFKEIAPCIVPRDDSAAKWEALRSTEVSVKLPELNDNFSCARLICSEHKRYRVLGSPHVIVCSNMVTFYQADIPVKFRDVMITVCQNNNA